MSIKIVSVAEMQAIEAAADAVGHSYDAMMQYAGRSATDFILSQYGYSQHYLILVGPGNNGGDGLVVARNLRQHDETLDVVCYLLKPREDQAFQDAVAVGVEIILADDDAGFSQLQNQLALTDVLVDGLFGTGISLPLRDNAKALLDVVRATQNGEKTYQHLMPMSESVLPFYVVALDCPSGLDCETGAVDESTIRADQTITFAAIKQGQLALPGFDYLGEIIIGDIGLPSPLPAIDDIQLSVTSIVGRLPARHNDSHKGTFGKALIVAGSSEYIGAAYLSGAAAYRVGAGLVTIGAPDSIIPTLAAMLPEATWFPLPRLITEVDSLDGKLQEGYRSLLIGPGLGQGKNTQQFLDTFLDNDEEIELPPIVIDADGLNLLAKVDRWAEKLPANTILTPHPAEFARLAEISTADVQSDRLGHARRCAEKWGCIVVLKGAFTVVAAPDGKAWINPFANNALATAGTGDVLAGAIVGLLAQGLLPIDAAIAGVFVHAEAASYHSPGMVASDLLPALSRVISASD